MSLAIEFLHWVKYGSLNQNGFSVVHTPKPDKMDMTTAQSGLNEILTGLIPQINTNITTMVLELGKDPIPTLASWSKNEQGNVLGINVGEIKSRMSITNVTGLSTLAVKSIAVSDLAGDITSAISGKLTLTAAFDTDMAATLSGDLTTSVGGAQNSTNIQGSANILDVKMTATGTFAATVNGETLCLTSLGFASASIDSWNLHLVLGDLGFFQPAHAAFQARFANYFNVDFRNSFNSALPRLFSDPAQPLLPGCKG
ncbi:MAG: hypothetical protein HEP71_22100 [Roseivirga sp.]|nr:hypothetical protein [Roseivirga sp.]